MRAEEREEQVVLSLAMGPIIPLYGIVEPSPGLYACECGNSDCANAGKHPRPRYRNKARMSCPTRTA